MPWLICTTWSIINLPTYNIATGIAERTIRSTAFVSVREGLVCQTNLKNLGIFPNAENLSFNVTSAIYSFRFNTLMEFKFTILSFI